MKKRTRTCEHFENRPEGCSNSENEKSRTQDDDKTCSEQENWESLLSSSSLEKYIINSKFFHCKNFT